MKRAAFTIAFVLLVEAASAAGWLPLFGTSVVVLAPCGSGVIDASSGCIILPLLP